MRVSPVIITAAARLAWLDVNMAHHDINSSSIGLGSVTYEKMMIAAAVAGVSTGTTTTKRPELSTEFFLIPESLPEKNGIASVASVVSIPAPNRTISIQQSPPRFPTDNSHVTMTNVHQTILRQRSWALPLAALSALAMLLMAAFEIFVLLKARAAAPSRRHLFLGQSLLLGLFLLAGLSAAASLAPNPLSCAAFRLVGLPAALVFAALLVKCVFLLSLNSGVYLPAPYQALVLIFAVLVQVAIVGQWFYGESPVVIRSRIISINTVYDQQNTCCKTPLGQTIASLGYPGILLIAVACLAVRARDVRDNYREAIFIGLAVGLTLPIWLTSAIGSIVVVENDREAWLAYGLLSTALIVFLTMFLPKGRQLAALGREGPGGIPSAVAGGTTVVIRDHDDDQLTSLPGSGYSPSFFHFKPAETTLKRKMHYQSADRVALVSSGMPGCSACRHGSSPVYSEEMQTPLETYVLPHGMYLQGPELDAANLYTTLSANPNVFFQRTHSGMIY
ncbi:hypothetical protein PV328_008306 [Microctonus aethiopoides]|uniref:G-protein coupled receptors family 3 profile domain-containing protein n=1 Tax=Microctonus aethiopoides TaxID=144406 RepID=A0AA39CAJ2_9HYME|nr:hypothetical protein PV328_008306 [Microctonus aethiopoides]